MENCLVWAESESQLLETTIGFKKVYERGNLECVNDKYAQILSIFVSNLPQEDSKKYFQHIGEIFHEISDCLEIKQLNYKY